MNSTTARRALIIVTVVLGCGVVAASSSDSTVTSDNGQKVSDSRAGAFDVCKQFVEERLKSPGSAKWRDPYGNQVTYTGDGNGPITVNASVDSQNGFGALLRSDYTCTVTKAGGNNWHLDHLHLDDGGG
jgi:hypothetical protein